MSALGHMVVVVLFDSIHALGEADPGESEHGDDQNEGQGGGGFRHVGLFSKILRSAPSVVHGDLTVPSLISCKTGVNIVGSEFFVNCDRSVLNSCASSALDDSTGDVEWSNIAIHS